MKIKSKWTKWIYLVGALQITGGGYAIMSHRKRADTFGGDEYPTEQQRMDVFGTMAKYWDQANEKRETKNIGKYRRKWFPRAKGHVLEVHVGTGMNIPVLKMTSSDVRSLVALDATPQMLELTRKKIEDTFRPKFPIALVHANSERIPYPDNSFDTVMGSYVLGSCEHPEATLKELRRVCKPNGQILLMEYGSIWFPFIRPLRRLLKHEDNVASTWETGLFDSRKPLQEVRAAGMYITKWKMKSLGVMYLIQASPNKKNKKGEGEEEEDSKKAKGEQQAPTLVESAPRQTGKDDLSNPEDVKAFNIPTFKPAPVALSLLDAERTERLTDAANLLGLVDAAARIKAKGKGAVLPTIPLPSDLGSLYWGWVPNHARDYAKAVAQVDGSVVNTEVDVERLLQLPSTGLGAVVVIKQNKETKF